MPTGLENLDEDFTFDDFGDDWEDEEPLLIAEYMPAFGDW